jgi:ribosomal protein L40E
MAIRVGRWDCRFCGHKGNLGPNKNCATCGRPRGDDVKFYLPEDAPEVTDASEIARARNGPDWICDHCGASNAENVARCQGCGNEKSQTDKGLEAKVYNLNEVPTTGEPVNPVHNPPVPKKKKHGCLVTIGIVFLILFGLYWLGAPRVIDVTVTGHEWKRTVDVECYRLVQHEDWSVPQNSVIIDSFQAVHHNKEIFDHYETRTRTVQVKVGEERYVSGQRDMGNGYFEDVYSTRPVYEEREEEYQEKVYRDEPVYQTKYVFTVYEWVLDRTDVAQGRDKNCNWPKGAPLDDKSWRNGAKKETYTLLFQDKKGKDYRNDTDYNHWERLNDNDRIKAKKIGNKLEFIDKLEKE